jgi:hypothetical protein
LVLCYSFVKPKEFEQAVLDLAMTTRVPLTRANLLFYTGVDSKRAEKLLDHMIAEGLLDFDSDDEGEIIYTVRGGRRPASGPTELTRCTACGRATGAGSRCTRCGQHIDARLRALKSDIERAGTALQLFSRSGDLLSPPREGEKSLLAAGLLGLFGPLGWLYAAPLREAAPAAGVFLFLMWLLPAFMKVMLMPLLMPLLPVSALVGVLYAWKYNRTGKRSGLLTEDGQGASPP